MNLKEMSVGEAAATIPEASKLFRRHQIDFCCGGQKPLAQIFLQHPWLEKELVQLIQRVKETNLAFTPWMEVPFPNLIEYILIRFHEKHRSDFPELIHLAQKVENRHKDHPLCPKGLTNLLQLISQELEFHMQKEEKILFPLLKNDPFVRPFMPINKMMDEHLEHKENLIQIYSTTQNFLLDDSACPTWKALYTNLKTFTEELQEHIHLENNVLFKRALTNQRPSSTQNTNQCSDQCSAQDNVKDNVKTANCNSRR